MKTYLNSLNERERWMVIGTTICVIVYCYYFFIYAPLSNKVTQKKGQLIEKIETLHWMQKVRQEAHGTEKKKSVDNSQLLTLLSAQLKKNTSFKFPYQLQQTGSGEIQLTFDAVPFKLFMAWLEKINERYSITIKQLDVNHSEISGVTKLTVIINAGN